MERNRCWPVIAMLLAAACGTASLPPADGNIPLGTWGGDTTGMIVGDTALHLHIGCTYGDVSGRVAVNAAGEFDVGGSFQLRAYPILVGPSMPARFTGRLDGDRVTVTVTVNDTVNHSTTVKGPVKLRLGDPPEMGPCPICRRPVYTR